MATNELSSLKDDWSYTPNLPQMCLGIESIQIEIFFLCLLEIL